MKEKVLDCKGKCVCFADGETGLVERREGNTMEMFFVPVGGNCRMQKGSTITILTRISASEFITDSFEAA